MSQNATLTQPADPTSGQLALKTLGPDAQDNFRFTWHNTLLEAACWVEYRGSWRPGVIADRGRRFVSVALVGVKGRNRCVRREYSELRRRIVKPRLAIVNDERR
jgi:hypothetical protein